MSHSKRLMRLFSMILGLFTAYATVTQAAPCVAPDNGGGTANVPESCAYLGEDLLILDGLPPGDSVVLNAPLLSNHTNVTRTPLATGESVTFDTEMVSLSLTGTGGLSGFSTTLTIPFHMEVHNDPRTPYQAMQSFDFQVMYLRGQIIGDPDFDLLRITGGTDFGLPSPGHTTLTQAGSNWAVDSFFDIAMRIDYIGAPGSPLAGRSGSTTGTYRFNAVAPVPVPPAAWLFGSGLLGLIGVARRNKKHS